MGRVTIHAGMPKAGSSSIQGWLKRNAAELAVDGIQPVRLIPQPDRIDFSTDTSGTLNSGGVAEALRKGPTHPQLIGQFMADLRDNADRHEHLVFSGESLAILFWRPGAFLQALRAVAADHDVQVAYYVRPQHTALEAAWRQWGFRLPNPPAAYLRHRVGDSNHYHYAETAEQVHSLAPEVDFRLRPFRRDLLHGGDVAVDFAHHFLGREADVDHRSRVNSGLSLEVVNALQASSGNSIWESAHENRGFNALKNLMGSTDIPDSEGTVRGRLVLQAWCHDRFPATNTALDAQQGWGGDFVPLVDEVPDLDLLDKLWAPAASAGLVRALRLLAQRHMISVTR